MYNNKSICNTVDDIYTITVHSTFQLHLYVVKLESEQKKNLNYEPLNTFMLFIKLPTLVPPKIYSL